MSTTCQLDAILENRVKDSSVIPGILKNVSITRIIIGTGQYIKGSIKQARQDFTYPVTRRILATDIGSFE